ncbi:MAG: hypothetical protein IJ038_00430 [Clostridia bacterium]|nr:hypothetical protein [Clostridia bacterium]
MKRIFALLLCFLMIFAVVSCSKDENEEENGGDKGITTSQKSSVSFYVNYKSVKIELGADAKAVISALGTAKSSLSMGNCGGLGTLTKYVYDSLEIYVLASGSTETVDQITLLDDAVQTPEKVSVGSAKDAVISACGNGYSKMTDTSITYTSGSKNLKFTLRDGTVTGIDYLTVS